MGYDLTNMLDYDKLKAKKPGGLGGLFAKNKVNRANEEIKAAVVDTNKDAKSTNTTGVKGVSTGAEQNDEANYVIDDGTDNKDETTAVGGESTTQKSEGTSDVAVVQGISDQYQMNTVAIQEMQSGLEGSSAEIVAQIQENLQSLNEAGGQLTLNIAEAEALGAELEGLTADEAGAGEFSSSMAAAGGANNAYGLNIPTGDNGAKANGAKKGGLISSGTQGTQQGGFAPTTPAGENSSTTERTRAIYARLAEIENENLALQETIVQCSDVALDLQITFTETTGMQAEVMDAQNQEAQQASAESDKTAEVFNQITQYGMLTKVAGVATESVGLGMTVSGKVMEGVGQTVKGTGTVMKGIGAGLKSLAAGLMGCTFTAPAGTAVGVSSTSVTTGGNVISQTGTGVVAIGKGVGTAGVTVQKVGKGVQVVGDATMTVGSAGSMVTNIAKGNILGAIGAGLSFLGSAASCINNTAQFATAVGAAKDSFLGAIQEFSGKMDSWTKGFNGGNAAKGATAQTLTKAGAAVTGWDQDGFGTSMLNVLSPGVVGQKPNTDAGASTGTQEGEPKTVVGSTISMRNKAKAAGLTEDQIKGKNDFELQKMIDALKGLKTEDAK